MYKYRLHIYANLLSFLCVRSVGNQKFEYASNLFIARVKLACLLFFHKDRKSALVEKTVNMTHTLFICRDARIKGAGGAAAPCPLAGGEGGQRCPYGL